MEYRRLGKSGLKVSVFSLGSWLTFGKSINDETARDLMHFAYDNGINFFDNAEIYSRGQSEIVMGNILAKSGWDRTTYSVSSKVFWGGDAPTQNGLNKKHIFEACHLALNRLQVDYLDLFFCHRPDPETPIEETVWAMHQLVMAGKVMYWGTSEWSADNIEEAITIAHKHNLVAPVMEQPQYNLINKTRFEQEYKPIFTKYGYGTTIWSPLATGLLSGKYNQGNPEDSTRLNSIEGLEWLRDMVLTDKNLEIAKKHSEIAKELGISAAQLALLWCLDNPNVSTIILGASKIAQLKENMETLNLKHLMTAEVKSQLDGLVSIA